VITRDNQQNQKEYLLECTNEAVRIYFAELIVVALNALAPHEQRFYVSAPLIFYLIQTNLIPK